MTHLKYKRLFGWLAAAILLLTTSCKDELFSGSGNSDEVTVSFALAPEAAVASTRAVYDDEGKNQLSNYRISDGSHVDMLIYAVYDEAGNLLEGYQGDSDEGFTPGDGQTIKSIEKFPCNITLTLKRGATYTVAFWAQSSKCKSFDTKNLRKVEMVYNEVKNNDETRDAFCRSFTFTAGADDIENPIRLYRPLAQVNVGASGFDYEIANRNSNKDYVYTKIRLNRVARYFDVFKDETYSSTTDSLDNFGTNKTQETYAVADFDYAKLPAYINMDIPEYISHTKYDWVHNPSYVIKDDAGEDVVTKDNYEGIYGKEEFLRVNLGYDAQYRVDEKDWDEKSDYTHNDKDYPNYLAYANLNDHYDDKSETFKYLSMCYVLTSSTKTEPIALNNVKVWIATDSIGSDSIEIVNLNNVPVQRNWRTNIIGNLLTDENSFTVQLDKDFAGEFNGIYLGETETAKWTGAIADGVYYDGEADEIQISNANGLLWFQRMVNGTITVRETPNFYKDGGHQGENYLYYEPTYDPDNGFVHKTTSNDPYRPKKYFSYSGITEPTNEELKERILVATHQKWNKNSNNGKWPPNGNFHFTGTKDNEDYPAKVRLMADIDMSGVEWIPIGFDGRMWDQLNNEFLENEPSNRGFYGVFDGNHHTVSNLTTKRFGTCVPDGYEERNPSSAATRIWDALQWFGRGFFGEVGGYAEIRNLILRNVDFKGCQGVGGIVGIVSGKAVKIENCVVDGGSLEVTPLYRGDKITSGGAAKNRTFARGVYLGGIVGYFYNSELDRNDPKKVSMVKNCEVRNLTMRGYRRLGGIIGSLDLNTGVQPSTNSKSKMGDIYGNSVVNSILIASQFNVFGIRCEYSDNVYKTGFGWDESTFDLLTQEFIGGDEYDPGNNGTNSSSNFTLSRFTEHLNNGIRYSEMEGVPLKYMPLLSSWYTDDITLQNNYYGEPSAKKITNLAKFTVYSSAAVGSQGNDSFNFPMNIPYNVDMLWADNVNNPNVGLYVESVTLDGKGGVGDRSVITPTQVDQEGACALFVTARDRYQFWNKYGSDDDDPKTKEDGKVYYQAPTVIKNIVVRGQPYAHTGIMLSPNVNMSKVELNTVAVYDVYQTLAKNTDKGGNNQWPNDITASETELEVINCNLRGYTVPGTDWKSITFTGTTFEKGKSTGHGENEQKYMAESATTFESCYFKAPYIIERSATTVNVIFGKGNKTCYATAAATKNTPIEPKEGWTRIEIDSDSQGNAIVKYTYADEAQSARRK